MASIHTEVVINADAEQVWKVISDWSDGPAMMAPGHVTSSAAEGSTTRVVTFADGLIARERLIGLDHAMHRIAYSVVGGTLQPEHDNAVMHIVAEGSGRCRFIWWRDLLPDDLAGPMQAGMETAAGIIKNTFETDADPRRGPA